MQQLLGSSASRSGSGGSSAVAASQECAEDDEEEAAAGWAEFAQHEQQRSNIFSQLGADRAAQASVFFLMVPPLTDWPVNNGLGQSACAFV